ncbi:MAG: class I SAM-dependent methyltransferase [Caldilineales bacterium]
MPPAGWALAVLAVGAVVAVVYWLVVSTEGAYLGPRFVTLQYDRYAGRYDEVKEFDEVYERHFIGEPVTRFLNERAEDLLQPVWVLDVASGTGRLPRSVLQTASSEPRFVCLDSSAPMLRQARLNLDRIAAAGQVVYVQHDARSLPFVDNAFPVVACLEALEFTPQPRAVIDELVRVARPGGLLVLTNRVGWQARLFPGRRFNREQLADLLRRLGCSYVSITAWQVDYDRVLAVKGGGSAEQPPLGWQGLLRCDRCGQTDWIEQDALLGCQYCGALVRETGQIWQFEAPAPGEDG